jgi:hypothetical protein
MKRRRDCYASSAGGSEFSISATTLAIAGGGPILGSLNLIFFSFSMTPERAASMTPERVARKYLSSMKEAVREIERLVCGQQGRWQAELIGWARIAAIGSGGHSDGFLS